MRIGKTGHVRFTHEPHVLHWPSLIIGFGLGVLALSLVPSAHAQQAQQAPTATEQALSSELMDQINKNVQLRTTLITLAKQLDEAKAKLAEHEKAEKKPNVAEVPKK